ncbi:hypothetical protein BLNAU_10756 [Blattamonas nauphoetae]|uniref:Uncharacterized protein n=1 Tax=Blattamonas nauphoetae TaxID=2049346 RepID=A0ABQ9XRP7_9EUKA|nr:hypothetical protein BLNAU_10756 [Blattamonas nauphoetae]
MLPEHDHQEICVTTLHPVSSSFVSDGVVSLLVASLHRATPCLALTRGQNHSVMPFFRLFVLTHNKRFFALSVGITAIDTKTDTSSKPTPFTMSIYQLPLSMDCSAFLNWSEDQQQSDKEKAVVFQSLIATVTLTPALDDALEVKAVNFLESVNPNDEESADAFLNSPERTIDESLTDFIQSIVVLLSSLNRVITIAAMKMIRTLVWRNSTAVHFTLVKADLIPQLINTLNPLSLSFDEAVDIHVPLMSNIRQSVWLATPRGLEDLEIEDDNEQQAAFETILKQVVVPSEKYHRHLCVNRYSIVDGDHSEQLMQFLARLLQICPYYQPTMDLVLHMPIVLTIPSCLTFFEFDRSIYPLLSSMVDSQREWNKRRGANQQMWKTVQRVLRTEGLRRCD